MMVVYPLNIWFNMNYCSFVNNNDIVYLEVKDLMHQYISVIIVLKWKIIVNWKLVLLVHLNILEFSIFIKVYIHNIYVYVEHKLSNT